jgi:hypothetical protein
MMLRWAALIVSVGVVFCVSVPARAESPAAGRKTVVSIDGRAFRINGRPTYEGRSWNGMKVEGLLMNSRMVQGIFDDRNPETRSRWNYPDGAWDPERNTREFLAAMPAWRQHGLLAFTINFQGGAPIGYANEQPWHNSAFEADGSLRADYLARLEKILDKADELGMVAIVGYFYFGQDERLKDEAAVVKATENATDWLLAKGYANVLVEINNECNVKRYEHDILKPGRVHELIELVKKRSEGKVKSPAGRLLASASMGGGGIPPETLVAAADFLLLHGNGVSDPDRIRKMVDTCRAIKAYRDQPILFNEDDHFGFDKPDNNMIAAVSRYASWGLFDYRLKGEGYDEGYQSVPANWGISSERKRGFFGLLAKMTGAEPAAKPPESGPKGEAGATGPTAAPATIETPFLKLSLSAGGACEIVDKAGGITWAPRCEGAGGGRQRSERQRLGQLVVKLDGNNKTTADLTRCEDIRRVGEALEATFRPLSQKPDLVVRVRIAPAAGGRAIEFSYEASDPGAIEEVRFLDETAWTTDTDRGCLVLPVREGLLIPADSGVGFTQSFDTYAYEGCHMQMVGIVKGGAAALVTWDDPYVRAEVRSMLGDQAAPLGKQILKCSLVLRKSARRVRMQFVGKGDVAAIAKAYREVAKEKGYLVTWDEKLKGRPDRARYFGAANVKLWSVLSRTMSDDSTKEVSVKVNWTFDEAARVAEHLKKDLKLDRVLFTMGGWIRRGYDNQHPDILPTAPECGGDAAFTQACKRIRDLGYILSLHDNYQDMYRDAPSYDESYIQKRVDGKLQPGGRWAGGICYITCSQRAVDLAKRPQNLPAVKKLSDADSYFIDTTYAAGLQECYAPKHPLTRGDDMKWKQAISNYARQVFGSFGSECGREWAIPCADFFEGFTGVSGTYYHDKALPAKVGAVPIPLFEMVYRDCIAMYGKYGYNITQADEYVLWHILIGRPLNYHNVPTHIYWDAKSAPPAKTFPLRPAVADFKQTGSRKFAVTYRWTVGAAGGKDWRVLVHFTDAQGGIKFQGDHHPNPPITEWQPGEVTEGPFTVTVPEGLKGTFDIRVGIFDPDPPQSRLIIEGDMDGEFRSIIGRVTVADGKIEFLPPGTKPPRAAAPTGSGLFVRGDGGWTEELQPFDRFLKNTYEILSPLNEITSRVTMTQHEFLTADRKARRSVFGEGAGAVEVTVNMGAAPLGVKSKVGGEVVLGPSGFLVEGPTFLAFSALKFGGLEYAAAPLFTVRSLDGKPVAESAAVRIYHGFGDPRIRIAGAERTVEKEFTGPAK